MQQAIDEHFSADSVLRAKYAAIFLGIGLSTLWRWSKEGRLPKGVRLSPRVTVWRVAELKNFLDRQQNA